MDSWIRVCEKAARAGGEQLMQWRGRFSTREKAPADLVTDADLASQRAIQEMVEEAFPEHAFLGEEQAYQQPDDEQPCWVVDPLDGTTNYVHGYPQFAVSVAIVQHSRPHVGVIYDPLRDECFRAVRERGAWLNGQPLKVTTTTELSAALVGASLPYGVTRNSPDLVSFCEVAEQCRGVRRSGSAALNLAYVSAGRQDGYWAHEIKPWDVAAGALLVEEAGAVLTGTNGQPFALWNPHFLVAATRELHAQLGPLIHRR